MTLENGDNKSMQGAGINHRDCLKKTELSFESSEINSLHEVTYLYLVYDLLHWLTEVPDKRFYRAPKQPVTSKTTR